MFIICNRDTLNDVTSPASYAISSKNTVPALEGFMITANKDDNMLIVCGYDMEKGVKVTLSGDNIQILESGKIIINAARFSSVLRNLPAGDVAIKVDENLVVTISSKSRKSEFTMHGLSGDTYPILPELKGSTTFKINRGTLKNMILTTHFAVSNDSNLPALNGALFEIKQNCINIIATDRFRIAFRRDFRGVVYDSSGGVDLSFIMPGKSLSELLKLIGDTDEPCEIQLTRKHVIVLFDNIVFFSRLIESEFIDYRRVMNVQPFLTAVIDTKEFVESVGRTAILTDDRQKSIVKLTFTENENENDSDNGNTEENGKVQMTSVTTLGKIYDECAIVMDGTPMSIGFNHRYLIDALKACEEDKVVLKLENATKSMLILPYYANSDDTDSDNNKSKDDNGEVESVTDIGGISAANTDEEIDNARFVYLVLPIRMRE